MQNVKLYLIFFIVSYQLSHAMEGISKKSVFYFDDNGVTSLRFYHNQWDQGSNIFASKFKDNKNIIIKRGIKNAINAFMTKRGKSNKSVSLADLQPNLSNASVKRARNICKDFEQHIIKRLNQNSTNFNNKLKEKLCNLAGSNRYFSDSNNEIELHYNDGNQKIFSHYIISYIIVDYGTDKIIPLLASMYKNPQKGQVLII